MTIFSRAEARQAGERLGRRIILRRRRSCVRATQAASHAVTGAVDERGKMGVVRRADGVHEGRKEGENWRRRKEGANPRSRTTSRTRGDFSSTLYPYPSFPSSFKGSRGRRGCRRKGG